MGQTYPFKEENDELLSEAEEAFDLSVRRESMLKKVREIPEAPPPKTILKSLAGLFSRRSQPAKLNRN
ncbi:hypothetical protein OIU34_37175 [Pararhizobium sp. BT-229]|uniref:hypothetical protein n=1 Tax=Pararhizobium sp. BT-229 TaxID=2986923 RepID=UPI0021F78017|nr:hypothetical protein [Pararhizobium sp. BT-229]MCV9967466.1 hypothetical protein [Pararhizobium sp. BT-229]